MASMPLAAQTAPGTAIVNTAVLRADAVASAVTSNTATLIVAERLDCLLTRGEQATPAMAAVVLTNTGSGREAFAVTASDDGGTARAVAVDEDGDGRFDPAHDRWLDGATPVLPPGGTLHLLVATEGGAAPAVTVSAAALTGSGVAGLPFAGRGDGGSDAVVGASGAAARLTIGPVAEVPPTIAQTQAVLAGDGSSTAQRGAVVTYTLVARFAAAVSAASLVDPIPAGTAYLPASLVLDGDAIADAGRVVDGRVVVPLGAVAASAVHRLVFKVVIQ